MDLVTAYGMHLDRGCIKKLKAVATDYDFIEFMKQLEIIKLDIEPFRHIKEMANTIAI